MPDGGGKIPSWKACPALFDVMGTGYTYKTPCDIEFVVDAAGDIHARALDAQHKDFLMDREPLPQFVHPRGITRSTSHGGPTGRWSFRKATVPSIRSRSTDSSCRS
jgi:hypothetical protein